MSDLLFTRGSFLAGVARILDLGGMLSEFDRSPSALYADRVALRADWRAVGADIWRAIDMHEAEQREQQRGEHSRTSDD